MKPAGVDSSDITTVELLVQRRLVTKRLNASVGVRNEASCRESSRMLMRESILGFLAANYDFDVGFFLCEDQGSGDRDAMSKSWPRQKGKYVSYIIKKDMYFLVFVRGPVSRCQISLQIFFSFEIASNNCMYHVQYCTIIASQNQRTTFISQHSTIMFIRKRDGRQQSCQFDKIQSRISKLCYGLDQKVRMRASVCISCNVGTPERLIRQHTVLRSYLRLLSLSRSLF